MKKICIITNKYPNPIESSVLVFVQQLVWTMADQGLKCSVICPMPVNINYKYVNFPYKTIEKTENGFTIDVYFPKYIGFGQTDILGFNPAKITTNNFTGAVCKVISRMLEKPDAVYGHFVTPSGITAARVGRKFGIPSFLAHGEATFMTIEHFGIKKVAEELSTLDGVIAVSTHNKEMLTSIGAVNEKIIHVFPNGYRKERFYPRDKIEARKKYGLPQDKFIVGFVGSFDYRKGIERLMDAVDKLDDVFAICAGRGKITPNSDKCLYHNSINNEDLPYFYSAADVFVLPTLNEGCCNAIIEAMACGLPIISSNLPFNDDILDESCSIKINPNDIQQISDAIKKLYNNNDLCNELSKGSLAQAKLLTLDIRAQDIINFVDMSINNEGKNV